jgi:hypothetical protein
MTGTGKLLSAAATNRGHGPKKSKADKNADCNPFGGFESLEFVISNDEEYNNELKRLVALSSPLRSIATSICAI